MDNLYDRWNACSYKLWAKAVVEIVSPLAKVLEPVFVKANGIKPDRVIKHSHIGVMYCNLGRIQHCDGIISSGLQNVNLKMLLLRLEKAVL